MKIFSGVYRECMQMRDSLEKLYESECHISEGGCRSMLNKALDAPMSVRADEVIKAIAIKLMSMKNIDVQELSRLTLHRLLDKSKQYGDSMEYPIRAFTELSVFDHINLKIDDKLCIVYNSVSEVSEDVYMDVLCYTILRKTFLRMNKESLFRKHKLKSKLNIGALFITGSIFLAGLSCIIFYILKTTE